MSSQRRLAVSYSRFSDPKQARGDSQDRQDKLFRDFCQWHNLTPCSEVFADKGKSGYKDEHRKSGRLGQLVAAAKDGRFEPGTVVVVEAWDRLGRLRPDRQTDLVSELLKTGVSIGVCRINDIFSDEDFGGHKWMMLAAFIQMAYQESKQKAERVGASWESRRQRARKNGTPVTGRTPAWLKLDGDHFRVIPEAVVAVKRVFALATAGHGRTRIVAALIAEGVPPFGRSGIWSRAYINRILNDRRVLGEYQPRRTDDTPDGPVIVGYYPSIITEDQWLLARAGQEKRNCKDKLGRALARTERKYVNVFRGMLTHARDGRGMFLRVKSQGKFLLVLCNHTGAEGQGKNYTFPYHIYEEAILDLLTEIDPAEVMEKKPKGPSRVDVLRARLAEVRKDMAGLQAELRGGFSKALAALLREKEAEEENVGKDLQEELAKAVRPTERAWKQLPSLAKLVAKEGDAARLRLRPVLRRIVEGAQVLIVKRASWLLCVTQIHFAGGRHRDFIIAYQYAGRGRPGGSWACSFSDAGLAEGALDLRDPKHAADLSRTLEAIDVAQLVAAMSVQ